jgi:acetyltransferase-like isoleucine patch superfamily enzyme
MISKTAIIKQNVQLGKNVEIGDYVLVGVQPPGADNLATIIGDNSVIRSHTVIYAGNTIGRNFQSGHGVLIRENNTLGDNVSIGSHTNIEHHVIIEDDVRIHSNVFVPEHSSLKKGSWLGPGVVLTNAKYPKSKGVKNTLTGPKVGEGAIVGANVTILPGVRVGAKSLIGAGSTVTKDVEEDSVHVGNPSRKLKRRSQIPQYQD